ncbi:DUF3889 domain-containing protein [Bacillus sp. S/N-304-OC-R1]|uniref:DUF3889 domain-containing protein n=1 Tax=Bacillus sp. S/N-304-OC-R1 TaxID=2758034 RepID=UPI001C8DF9E7|nr:DUF3889 domain-containing protein [Bacillus sp. S/N-304-OC-R1]MBY0123136.1 DUF3889 domain-containing protein [Bacillus sp. S/N-304-OC-R1]
MKKLLYLFVTACLFLHVQTLAFAENNADEYEKYGRIAIAVVKEDYPGENVVEYQYAGRQNISETDVVDSFIFNVKENNQLKKVTVKVSHSLTNKKLLQLTVE